MMNVNIPTSLTTGRLSESNIFTEKIFGESYLFFWGEYDKFYKINEVIKKQLGLRVRQQLNISLADGTKRLLDVAGPIRMKFGDRDCITDAFVLPNNEEALIGAVPMELMDLVIVPAENKLMYNPLHPDGPLYSLK